MIGDRPLSLSPLSRRHSLSIATPFVSAKRPELKPEPLASLAEDARPGELNRPRGGETSRREPSSVAPVEVARAAPEGVFVLCLPLSGPREHDVLVELWLVAA
jgi:hypothetical protein